VGWRRATGATAAATVKSAPNEPTVERAPVSGVEATVPGVEPTVSGVEPTVSGVGATVSGVGATGDTLRSSVRVA